MVREMLFRFSEFPVCVCGWIFLWCPCSLQALRQEQAAICEDQSRALAAEAGSVKLAASAPTGNCRGHARSILDIAESDFEHGGHR